VRRGREVVIDVLLIRIPEKEARRESASSRMHRVINWYHIPFVDAAFGNGAEK
jgi:hypothetical protein